MVVLCDFLYPRSRFGSVGLIGDRCVVGRISLFSKSNEHSRSQRHQNEGCRNPIGRTDGRCERGRHCPDPAEYQRRGHDDPVRGAGRAGESAPYVYFAQSTQHVSYHNESTGHATKALSASIDKKGVYCQAFSDPNGRDELRAPFSAEDDDVIFTKNPDGLALGSFLCSDSIDKLDAPGQRPMEGDSSVDEDDDDGEESVVLQFRTGFQEFSRGTVPAGKLFSLGKSVVLI